MLTENNCIQEIIIVFFLDVNSLLFAIRFFFSATERERLFRINIRGETFFEIKMVKYLKCKKNILINVKIKNK